MQKQLEKGLTDGWLHNETLSTEIPFNGSGLLLCTLPLKPESRTILPPFQRTDVPKPVVKDNCSQKADSTMAV